MIVDNDKYFMELAIKEAERAAVEGEVPVGCVIVHEGMVIGKDGRTIRALGQLARSKIETLLGEKTYLDLWVKVLPKWRTSGNALRMLGLHTPTNERDR